MVATVLVVEDERKLRDLVRLYLERAGFTVLSTDSGAEAITMALASAPDLVILDLGLPDVPGETVARELRASGPTLGHADPDLDGQERRGRPDPRARAGRRRLRDQAVQPARAGPAGTGDPAPRRPGRHPGDSQLRRGELVIDEPQRQAMVRGVAVALTPTEWGVLTALATVPGRVYSRFELINRVRGYEFEGYERTVDSHVKNLRRKVEEDPGNPEDRPDRPGRWLPARPGPR